MENNVKFDFEKEVKKIRRQDIEVYSKTLLEAYSNQTKNKAPKKGKSTPETESRGVYALYLKGELKKIGKASNGIFKRMSQYYRMTENEGCKHINKKNRNSVEVKWYILDNSEDCWIDERRLQVIAYDLGEQMDWEVKK